MVSRNGARRGGVVALLFVAACGKGAGSSEGPAASASARPLPARAQASAMPIMSDAGVNGCAPGDFVDQDTISWNYTVTPRCVRIKVGQSVKWNGDLTQHFLIPLNGDLPNPIADAKPVGNSTYVATFPKPGTFGFKCPQHMLMFGAVQVVK